MSDRHRSYFNFTVDLMLEFLAALYNYYNRHNYEEKTNIPIVILMLIKSRINAQLFN